MLRVFSSAKPIDDIFTIPKAWSLTEVDLKITMIIVPMIIVPMIIVPMNNVDDFFGIKFFFMVYPVRNF
jgi:hypothetical protein